MLNDIWKNLYNTAKAAVNPKEISAQICSGGVGAAVLAKNGNLYTGVNIDTDCSLGMCAERNVESANAACTFDLCGINCFSAYSFVSCSCFLSFPFALNK